MNSVLERKNADLICQAIEELDGTMEQIRDAVIDLRSALNDIRDELRAIGRQISGMNP